MNDVVKIASMPLYMNLDRIARGLADFGIGPTDPIPPAQLFSLDQWHYHGTEAIGRAAERLGLGPTSRVLEIGAGVGGPARYLAHTVGCHVTALELQREVHAIAADLTERCGLADRVTHICSDALTCPLPDKTFDAVVSWLAFLHIPERPRLCGRLAQTLRPGGLCYIEDLTMRAPFSAHDLREAREIVYAITLTDIEDYKRDLRAAGFADVYAVDLTDEWAPYVAGRLAAWRERRVEKSRIYGEQAYLGLEMFYDVMARLFESGSLGGVRMMARAPNAMPSAP